MSGGSLTLPDNRAWQDSGVVVEWGSQSQNTPVPNGRISPNACAQGNLTQQSQWRLRGKVRTDGPCNDQRPELREGDAQLYCPSQRDAKGAGKRNWGGPRVARGLDGLEGSTAVVEAKFGMGPA